MLKSYTKYKQPWLQLIIFVAIALIISQIIVAITLPIVSHYYHLSLTQLMDILQGNLKHPSAKVILTIFQSVQFFVLFLIPSYLFAYYADPNPLDYLGLDKFPKTHYFIKSVALIFVGILAVGVLGYLNKLIPLPKSITDVEDKQNAAVSVLALSTNIKDLVLSIILVGLFAAVGEELFFRAVLQRLFIQWTKSPWAGIIITSIIFSSIHMQFSGFLPRLGLGIILGAIYWYSGSLWPGILFHFIYNSLGVIMAYINPKSLQQETPLEMNPAITFIFGILSIGAVVYIIMQMKKQSTTDYAKIYPVKEPDFLSKI